MHCDRILRSIAVQPADIALRIMKAHEPVNHCNLEECRVEGAMRLLLDQAFDADTNQRTQPRLRPLNGPMV
jgi:hypothetical protein